MKKRLLVFFIVLVSMFIISTSTLIIVRADDEPVAEEVVPEPTLQSAANEVRDWWQNSMLPWILTAVAGASGSGIVGLAVWFMVSKARKKLKETIEDASKALSLSADANAKLNASSNALMERVEDLLTQRLDVFSKAISKMIDDKLDEKLKNYEISAEEVTESRQRLLVLAYSILKSFNEGEIVDENKD